MQITNFATPKYHLTGFSITTSHVQDAGEELQTDDGINDDHEQHQERDVKQRYHRF